MSKVFDVAIVGAGPGGMSAALELAGRGLSIVVLDRRPMAGGQIYRNVDESPLSNPAILGSDYTDGATLVSDFLATKIECQFEADVWHVDASGQILFTKNGVSCQVSAREIILSPGAMERPFPIPGWHLPGVMTAGSAQVMLKSDGLVRDGAIFAGCGPLLYLIVAQYCRLGVPVRAVVDTTEPQRYVSAMRHVFGALGKVSYLLKGMGLLAEIKRAGIPFYFGARDLRVVGDRLACGLAFTQRGKEQVIETDHVFLHQGVLPNLNMTRALDLDHDWSRQQLCWVPSLDTWGQSSLPHVAVIGDAAGILGADAAKVRGRLAARKVLVNLGVVCEIELERQSAKDLSDLRAQERFRTFIDSLYRPADGHRMPQDDHCLVCRCEEQTVAQLRMGFEAGAQDPNALKALTRCGMGPCQGRQCGHTVSELLAKWRGEPVQDVGYYRLRTPQRLLSVDEFSNFETLSAKASGKQGAAGHGV